MWNKMIGRVDRKGLGDVKGAGFRRQVADRWMEKEGSRVGLGCWCGTRESESIRAGGDSLGLKL